MPGRTLSARPRAASTVDPDESPAIESGANADAATPTASDAALEIEPAGHGPALGKITSLQDRFLNLLRKNKTPITMFLVKGVKLQGIVTWFDNFSILLRRDGQAQLVYKHAISTIMPSQPVDIRLFAEAAEGKKKTRLLQDIFLNATRGASVQVTMFLINGVMLQGRIAAFDLFSILLEREGYVQLAYKHAVSTIQPLAAIDLSGDEWDDEDTAR